MITKHYYLILFSCLLFFSSTKAQQFNVEQIDTIRISSSQESKLFIIKVDTSEIILKDDFNYLITKIEINNLNDNSLFQTIIDTSEMIFGAGGVDFVDVNLDGYLDLDLNLGYSNLMPIHSFWLYCPKTKQFFQSPEYSQLNDYDIDIDKKEIESYSQSTGGRGGSSEKYKIKNGNLVLLETEYSNFYEFVHQRLIDNILRTDSLVETGSSEDGTSIFEIYNLVKDSLLLTEKIWAVDIEPPYSNEIYDNEIYDCEPWGGCIKYLRKEIYLYGNKKQGYTVQDTVRYQVINNKWQKVKIFFK